MDKHVCNFRHANKSQLLDIDENEMKRMGKREDVCFKKKRKSNPLIFYERERERGRNNRLLKIEKKIY